MTKKVHGFSLIEVLIASFILFISLATFSLVFRSALLSSDKAQLTVSTAAYTNLIVDKVTGELRNINNKNSASGQGKLLDRTYRWQAKIINSTRPPARYFGTELIQADHQAHLWQVKLVVRVEGKEESYDYQEVTW